MTKKSAGCFKNEGDGKTGIHSTKNVVFLWGTPTGAWELFKETKDNLQKAQNRARTLNGGNRANTVTKGGKGTPNA